MTPALAGGGESSPCAEGGVGSAYLLPWRFKGGQAPERGGAEGTPLPDIRFGHLLFAIGYLPFAI